jgi:hypothetical protein
VTSIKPGMPIADGIWVGAVVIASGRQVLAVAITGDVSLASSYRVFASSSIELSCGIAHVVRSSAADIVATWHAAGGRRSVPAVPRSPSCPAAAR